MSERIPVIVLTGWLGAGKTTLLNRILAEDDGRRYAVIVNEFGEIGIDSDLVVGSDEELFAFNNGCVCCTVRGDLIRTLHGLLARPGGFDAIVIETTGLADPGPVAQTFFVDDYLQARTALDSITTLVDARHIGRTLADRREAAEQVAFADQVVVNKTDLVSQDELRGVEAGLRRLNPLAPIHRATRADVPLDRLLGRGGFDLDRIAALEPDFLAPAGDSHAGHAHDHPHYGDIGSVSLTAEAPMDGDKVSAWLSELAATSGEDILRAKGIIQVAGEDRRLVFQAVHMLVEGELQRPWRPDERRVSRLVFIGRNLDAARLEAELAACAADG
jgi:G3E family GTPase